MGIGYQTTMIYARDIKFFFKILQLGAAMQLADELENGPVDKVRT
jgi:hypothetical protein